MLLLQSNQPKTMQEQLVSLLKEQFGTEVTADAVKSVATQMNTSYATASKYLQQYKVGRGKWNLEATVKELEQTYQSPAVEGTDTVQTLATVKQNLIPQKDATFVNFGNFTDIKKVVSSGLFYPAFITGLSGNGKTFGVEQACAQLGRELIRVNITIETDEDDLIGGFRLVNGETVWHNGPVVEAMERGAVLLLDELDLASNKIMCLQSVLEGKGVFLKKIGKHIMPKAGFTVFATANTKGKGSDDGRFIGTNVLNEAFLERFPITFEQEYPTASVETKILTKVAESLNIPMIGEHTDFIKHLCNWSDIIRKTFADGGIDEVISTRRLVHIMKAYSIFGKKDKALKVCLNRFDDETKTTFVELYDKIDAEFQQTQNNELQLTVEGGTELHF
jgi:midasin (ATPase involved in ribosome maturation)